MRGMVLATGVLALVTVLSGQPAAAGGQWQRENVPSRPATASMLTSVSTGGGATMAFGGWRERNSAMVTQGWQRAANGEWRELPVPNVGEIKDSLVLGAADVWAVSAVAGDNKPIVHWNGTGWTSYAVTPPERQAYLASVARAGGQLWAAGSSTGFQQENQALLLRWDGKSWIDTGISNDVMASADAVAGTSPSDVWAVGGGYRPGDFTEVAVAAHWDGVRWTETPLPALDRLSLSDLVALAADDVWAVGTRFAEGVFRPVALHWDGTTWSEVSTPQLPGGLTKLAKVGRELWAVGPHSGDTATLALRYDGAAWQRVSGTPAGVAADATALPGGRPVLVGAVPTSAYQSENLAAIRVRP